MPAFALTIFAGAFLLFQVQPLIGKYILPWFGGSPGVWTTCMLFFQLLLLGGYAYAHVISTRLKPRTQAVVHLVLLAAALAVLPVTPSDSWKPAASGDPTGHILLLLLASLGLPYLVLSATGPLMQDWFRRTAPGASPYRLYALSNVGSLLALVSYPFYFEITFTRHTQASLWSWGLVCYAICCAFCAWRVWQTGDRGLETGDRKPETAIPGGAGQPSQVRSVGEISGFRSPVSGLAEPARPGGTQRLLWLILPACASVLLLAVTNKMCQDVAPTPFLWVLPLGLYLLTFIISFDSPRWYSRFYYTLAFLGAAVAVCHALFEGADLDIKAQIVTYAGMLFIGCMLCHGELYQLRPHPRYLTSFYLMISAGGALGGLFVALVAPAIFNNYYEIHLAVALTAALLLVLSFRGRDALTPRRWQVLAGLLTLAALYGADRGFSRALFWLRQRESLRDLPLFRTASWAQLEGLHWLVWVVGVGLVAAVGWRKWKGGRPFNGHAVACVLLAAGLGILSLTLVTQIRDAARGALLSARNFYGVLSVFEYEKERPEAHYYLLLHGRITHGLQFVSPSRASEITSYFGSTSGLGLALRHFPRQQNQRVGLLGLGVGTVTAYGKPGDYYRVYEINPQVKDIATKPFSYVARSPAKVDIVMGDGRLSMENEPPQDFDILIMDAFSSDAVPVHLLTREAFEIYRRHLKPDGAILVNISNRYLDLRPVVENAAKEFGFQSHHINSEDGAGEEDETGGWWLYGSSWMILSKNQEFMNRAALRAAASPPLTKPNTIPLWTDDYASMFTILQ